jgi:hypothetical protein
MVLSPKITQESKMIMAKKAEKPKRSRAGYVMVELNDAEHRRLEKHVEDLSAYTHTRSSKAAVLRYFLLNGKIPID